MDVKRLRVEGHVEQQFVSPGSKSERNTVVLVTPSGERFVLRRHGGPTFVDESLRSLVGRTIRAEGLSTDGVLIMKKWETAD